MSGSDTTRESTTAEPGAGHEAAVPAIAPATAASSHGDSLLRSILDSAFEGAMAFRSIRDGAGRISDFEWVMVNDGAERMVGRSRQDLLGRRRLEEIPDQRDAGLFRRYVAVVETGEAFEDEHLYRHHGSGTWFAIRAVRLDDGLVVTFTDITARKRAELERDRFFRIFPDLLSIIGQDGRFRRLSASWQRCLGWSAEDMVGQTGLRFIHPDDVARTRLEWKRLLRGQQSIGFENRYRCRDGSFRWLQWTLVPESDGLLYGVARDITARHEAIEHLEASEARALKAEQRLLDAIECITEGFVLWDAEERLVLCNSRYRDFYPAVAAFFVPGVRFEEVLRRCVSFGIYALDESPEAWVAERLRCFRNPGGAREYRLSNGRWLLLTDRRTSDGGVVGVRTDITEIKRHEARMLEKQAELERFIAELEASRRHLSLQADMLTDLTEKYAAEKQRAEAANFSKARFLANMSHELRTPLNAILGFADLLREQAFGPLGSECYIEYAQDIFESGRHLLNLINNILDMSKVDTGKYRLIREPVAIDRVVTATVRMVEARADLAGIALRLEVADGLLAIPADERAIRQILLNLLSNAVKFTPPGGMVTVDAGLADGRVKVSVADSGIGIPADQMHRVGEPFEQIDSQHARRYDGSGLGLALCKSLVELHGGTLAIASTVGVGTTVSFTLPLDPPEGRRAVAFIADI